MQSEQYSNFLALSSSVSGFDGLLEADVLLAPEVTGPVPGCSELPPPPLPQLLLLLLQPGEEEEPSARGGVGVVMTEQTEGLGESMGGVGGLVRGVRGPAVRRGPFNSGSGCGSSEKEMREENT